MKRLLHERRLAALVMLAAGLLLPGLSPRVWAGGCPNLLRNGSFELGPNGDWSETSLGGNELITTDWAHGGQYAAYLGGSDDADDTLSQVVTIPSDAGSVTLTYWWAINTLEDTHPHDRCTVELRATDDALLQTLETIVDTDDVVAYDWQRCDVDLTAYRGRQVKLVFHAVTDSSSPTEFFIDDVALTTCQAPAPGSHALYLPLALRPAP